MTATQSTTNRNRNEGTTTMQHLAKHFDLSRDAETFPTTCPACMSDGETGEHTASTTHATIYRCRQCGAIHGEAYLGSSFAVVKNEWELVDVANSIVGEEVYYDLTCIGSDGLTRRHGWFNPTTGRVTQTG